MQQQRTASCPNATGLIFMSFLKATGGIKWPLTTKSALLCLFRDNLCSTGLVYMKDWDNPKVKTKTCYGLIAWGRIQKSPDPPLPGCSALLHARLKDMWWGKVKVRCTFVSTVANSNKKSPLNDIYVVSYWLLSLNSMTVDLVTYWD